MPMEIECCMDFADFVEVLPVDGVEEELAATAISALAGFFGAGPLLDVAARFAVGIIGRRDAARDGSPDPIGLVTVPGWQKGFPVAFHCC